MPRLLPIVCVACVVTLAGSIAQAQSDYDKDVDYLEEAISEIAAIESRLSTLPQVKGSVSWIRAMHTGNLFDEVAPFLDSARAKTSGVAFVFLFEAAASVPWSRRDVVSGAYGRRMIRKKELAGRRSGGVEVVNPLPIPSPAWPYAKAKLGWINRNLPMTVLYEERSPETLRLGGLCSYYKSVAAREEVAKNYKDWLAARRLSLAFTFVNAWRRDTELRELLRTYLGLKPTAHIATAFGSGHRADWILRGIDGAIVSTPPGISGNRIAELGRSLEDTLRDKGFGSWDTDRVIEFGSLGWWATIASRKSAKTHAEVHRSAERETSRILARYGSWTKVAEAIVSRSQRQPHQSR